MTWILVLGLTASLGSANAAGSFTLLGVGTQSCGAWVQAREGRGHFPAAKQAAMLTWAQGFLSAAVVVTGRDILRDLDPAAMKTWLDNYCQKHPIRSVWQALGVLVSQLRLKAPQ